MRSLLEAYFATGGMQLQINVCDGETLRKAMEHPEAYRSLVVRVGGYSDYFVNLSRALQEEILLRTEQAV
jgi:formate C-acetyltransferase